MHCTAEALRSLLVVAYSLFWKVRCLTRQVCVELKFVRDEVADYSLGWAIPTSLSNLCELRVLTRRVLGFTHLQPEFLSQKPRQHAASSEENYLP